MVHIKVRMKKIKGVCDVAYNFDAMSLAVYYAKKADLDLIKIKVKDEIDKAGLHRAIEKINFYSMSKCGRKKKKR